MRIVEGSVGVGGEFGVIAVSRNGLKVEVATFRTDAGYSDGRHPDSVVYARAPKEDVQRRDFTINGLLMRHDASEVLDYVGGQVDPGGGVIPAGGEPGSRLPADHLRWLPPLRIS